MERIINQYRDSAPFNFQQHATQSWQRLRHVFTSIMNMLMKNTLTCTIWKYQNATSSHIFNTVLKWNMEIVVDEESTSAPVSSQQYSTPFRPYLHLLPLSDMNGVSREHDIFTWYRSHSLMFSSPYDKQEISNNIMEKIINQSSNSAPLNFQQHTARSWQHVRHVFISIMKHTDEEHTDMYHIKFIKTPRHHTYTTLYWNEIWKSLLMKKVPQLQSAPSNVQHQFGLTYICCYEVIWMEYRGTMIYLYDTGLFIDAFFNLR